MITSSSNAQVKQMIQLNKKARERRKQDVFIVEGLRMFREVPRDRLVKTYVSENFLEDPEHEALLQGIPYEVVKDSVFALYKAFAELTEGNDLPKQIEEEDKYQCKERSEYQTQ